MDFSASVDTRHCRLFRQCEHATVEIRLAPFNAPQSLSIRRHNAHMSSLICVHLRKVTAIVHAAGLRSLIR